MLIALLANAVVGLAATHQNDMTAQITAWVHDEMARASQWWQLGQPLGAAVRVDWSYEDFFSLSPAQLADLRSQVEGRPQHPRSHELKVVERHLRGEPVTMSLAVLVDGEQRWRFLMDFQNGAYQDAVYNHPVSWKMSDRTVELLDPDGVAADVPQQAVRSERFVFVPDLDRLFFGGLGSLSQMSLVPVSVVPEGQRWLVHMAGATQSFVARLRIRWDTEADRGFVEELVFAKVDKASGALESDETERYGDWKLVEGLAGDRRAATSIDLIRPGANGPWRRISFRGARVLNDTEFTAALTPPARETRDAIRGPVASHAIADYVRGTVEEVDSQGRSTVVSPLPTLATSERPSFWRWVGWVTLGALIAAVIAVRQKVLLTRLGKRLVFQLGRL